MKKSLLIGIGIILLILGVIFDRTISNFLIGLRFTILNNIMLLISLIGSALSVFIITTLIIGFNKKKRSYIPALWISLIVSLGITLVLKYLIARLRPMIVPLQSETDYSFPSGHATAVFAPLALIDFLYPRLKWLWLILGIFVLISRVYLGVHYFSDVIAGALIGYITGVLILNYKENHF